MTASSNSESSNSNKSKPTIFEGIPLTLADISRSKRDPDQGNVYIIDNWHYQSCIVYAFVVGRGIPNDTSSYKYIIDDGTASMQVSIPSNVAKRTEIASLYNETMIMAFESKTAVDQQSSRSMARLLRSTNQYIDTSIISPGMNIFLDGRPSISGDKIEFDAFSFCLDNQSSRIMEIAFNDHLMDCYTKRKIKEAQ